VIKVHRWRVSVDRLSAVQSVQAHLAGAGLPAPRPLLAPEPLGNGVATVEELLEAGTADGRLPAVRRELAVGLFAFVGGASGFRGLKALGPAAVVEHLEGSPYFEPHDLRFDFEATAVGAEWIDELALVARRRLDERHLDEHGQSDVVGHLDWQVGNVGFSGGRLSAIYDWDSVALAPEPVVVGAASAQFSADWQRNGALPSADDMRSFVVDYEQARGEQFSDEARGLLDAANLLHCAYGARCQHSDLVLGSVPGASAVGGWIDVLRRRPAQLFGS
jgi:hypothetical protein